ncbi:MAG: hypothetical protein ACTSRS_17740 [Candidatus Helarchaeota archaeon]
MLRTHRGRCYQTAQRRPRGHRISLPRVALEKLVLSLFLTPTPPPYISF